MTSGEYVSLEALAAALGLPRAYLRRLADDGHIPSLNVNGRLRFDESSVRTALHDLQQQRAAPSRHSHKSLTGFPGDANRQGGAL